MKMNRVTKVLIYLIPAALVVAAGLALHFGMSGGGGNPTSVPTEATPSLTPTEIPTMTPTFTPTPVFSRRRRRLPRKSLLLS